MADAFEPSEKGPSETRQVEPSRATGARSLLPGHN
jgi:hypothetical protein